ncbi:MAG: hypothetical protein Fur0021_20560 [Candidatus Promineifilaceae bacterium]
MRIITRLSLLALLLLLLAACGGSDNGADAPAAMPTSVGDAAAGAMLFQQSCASCHGPAAKGIEGLGKDMTTSVFIHDLNDEELLAFVKTGRPTSDPANTTGVDMPPKGGNPALSDDQILDIIAYIRTLQQ